MPHLVTSAQTDPHVLSSNDARLMAGIYGNGSYVLPVCNRMAATMVNTNTLRILDGDALTCGRHWAIDDAYEEYDVENGTPGMKRIDLVVARIKTAPVETIEIVVIKGDEVASNPVTPGYVEGDLNAGDTITEMPLYTIPIDGINPGEPVPKFTVSESMTQAWDSLSQKMTKALCIVGGQVKVTVPAGSFGDAIISLPIPTNYRAVAIARCQNDSVGACVSATMNTLYSDGRFVTQLRNTTNSVITTTVQVSTLCARADLL